MSTQQEVLPTILSQGDALATMELLPVESLVYQSLCKFKAKTSDGVQGKFSKMWKEP